MIIAILVTTAVLVVGALIIYDSYRHSNPYEDDGLVIEWDVGGATNAYPWINVWVDHDGERIKPALSFGGIEYPELRFRDYDGDGHPEIIFEDDRYMQVVAFHPASGESKPSFKILRNDVTWP